MCIYFRVTGFDRHVNILSGVPDRNGNCITSTIKACERSKDTHSQGQIAYRCRVSRRTDGYAIPLGDWEFFFLSLLLRFQK